jgi:hypothetical protein
LPAQEPAPAGAAPTGQGGSRASAATTNDSIARIRDEGLNRSQVMETLTYLTDVIGPRLTGSPALKRANEWTRDRLASWGLTNAHLEAWPFGRGWSLRRFSAQIVEPQSIPLTAWPQAWSCGADWPLVGEVIHLNARTEADLEPFKGRLKGAVVLLSPPREVRARFEPLTARLSEAELLRLANATSGRREFYTWQAGRTNPPAALPAARAEAAPRRPEPAPGAVPTNVAPPTNQSRAVTLTNPPPGRARPLGSNERAAFATREGAAVLVTCSPKGDAGHLLAGSAMTLAAAAGGEPAEPRPRAPWATNAPPGPPQITLATEDYNRLTRMLERGERLRMAVELQTQFHTNDLMAYNTLAEIPGADRPRELVMLGGHLDSWHMGTGATDNAAGVAVCMEAVRILQALKLQPRRTIRIGLWAGEEQGFLGSRPYVSRHFGYFTNVTATAATRSPKAESQDPPRRSGSGSRATRELVRHRDYDRLSAYFNLDNGGGRIRGIYLQGNEGVRPYFARWLEPFRDLGAETLSPANTGGTDHIPFDAVGLPGFQFIQDPMDYMSRTHHTTADVSDRIVPDDLKQAAVLMAAFAYQTAMLDEKLPRKTVEPSGDGARR